MEKVSDLRDAYAHLEEALVLLDRWDQHLPAAEVDSARERLARILTNLNSPETT